jgi:hypothetical protein
MGKTLSAWTNPSNVFNAGCGGQRRRCEHTRRHPEIACRMHLSHKSLAPSIGCHIISASKRQATLQSHQQAVKYISTSSVLSSLALSTLLVTSRLFVFKTCICYLFHWAVAAAARRYPAKSRSSPVYYPPSLQHSRISLLLSYTYLSATCDLAIVVID